MKRKELVVLLSCFSSLAAGLLNKTCNAKKNVLKLTTGILVFMVMTAVISCSENTRSEDYTQYVNPFVGAAEYGHCFPGACVPLGLIQAGPETGNGVWAYCSGYQYEDSTINGRIFVLIA